MATDDKKWARNCRLRRVVILTRGLLGGCAGMRRQSQDESYHVFRHVRREDTAALRGHKLGPQTRSTAPAGRRAPAVGGGEQGVGEGGVGTARGVGHRVGPVGAAGGHGAHLQALLSLLHKAQPMKGK